MRAASAAVPIGGHVGDGGGFFHQPTVIADVPLEARALNDEPSGPVAFLRLFSTVDDAVEQADRLPFGLATYCFTKNGRRPNLLAEAVHIASGSRRKYRRSRSGIPAFTIRHWRGAARGHYSPSQGEEAGG